MILSRIRKALEDQNWLSIAIEFVIVVAGVMLAFQVTQWSQDRAEAERRAVALDRLQEEIETSAGTLVIFLEMYETLNSDRNEVIERLLNGDFEDMDGDAMKDALVSTSLFPAFSPPQGVYTEITSSGMVSSLGDARFRDALGRYQSSVDFLQGQINYFRLLATSDREDIRSFDAVRLEFAPDTPRGRRHIVDWNAAAADPALMQYILNSNNRMRAMQGWWQDTHDAAMSLCEETARLTGRPCEPEGANPS